MAAFSKSVTHPWFFLALALGFLIAFALGFSMCGPSGGNVPNLVGLNLQEGEARTENEGFALEIRSRQYSSEPEDTIISQDPEPGVSLEKGGRISVVVSGGEETGQLDIPDLLGMTEDDARLELGRLGLVVSVTYEQNLNYSEGVVVGQEPAGGKAAQVGSTVTLAVAKKDTAAVTGFIVCLDPGHANTPSQIDEDTGLNTMDWVNEPEIQVVFDITTRVKGMLEARGVRVVMTKQSVYDPINLKQRAVIANEAGAALVLHVHTDPNISLPSTYYPGAGELGWKANYDTGRKAYIDPQVQLESERLAKAFHAAMASYMRDRYGVGEGGILVENRGATGSGNYGPIFSYDVWSRVPTFTIENNQAFADSNRQAVAEGIVEGIMVCLEDR